MSTRYRLPPEIHNTYSRYKSHTQHILRWISTTAASLPPPGTPSEPAASTPASKSRNSKGKRNSKGRGGASQPQRPPQRSTRFDPEISLGTLLSYAKRIATAGLKAPKDIIERITSVIQHRKLCAAFYSSDADATKGNAGHRHAIKVYVEILELLGGKDGESPAGPPKWIPDGGTECLAAMVHALTLSTSGEEDKESKPDEAAKRKKEAEEWLKDNPFVQQQLRKKNKENQRAHGQQPEVPEYPLEAYVLLEDDFYHDEEKGKEGSSSRSSEKSMDLEMAVTCFFSDCAQIRAYVSEVWRSAAPAGKIARTTAALVSNQAMQIVATLEKELFMEFPVLQSASDIYAVVNRCFDQAEMSEQKSAQVEEGLMLAIYQYVDAFGHVLEKENLPTVKDGLFLTFDPNADRSTMNRLERQDEDMSIIMTYLPELVTTFFAIDGNLEESVRKPHVFIGDDGLGLELYKFWKTENSDGHPVTMPLVFGAQLMLDTIYIRREAGITGVSEMKTMRSIQRQICADLDSLASYKDLELRLPNNMDELFFDIIESRSRIMKLEMNTDALHQFKLRHKVHEVSVTAATKDLLWTMNPWLCANASIYALTELWNIGVMFTGGTGFINSAMALWNMLKQMGHIKETKRPSDEPLLMDHLLSTFCEQVFHAPKPPRSNFLLHFYKMQGGMDAVHAGGHTVMEHDSDIFMLYEAGQSRDIFHRIVEKWAKDQTGRRSSGRTQLYDSSRLLGSGYTSSSSSSSPSPPPTTSPAYNLHTLLTNAEQETHQKLRIKWIALQYRLIAAFRHLRSALQTLLSAALESPADKLFDDESQLPYVTGYVMTVCENRSPSAIKWRNEVIKKTAEEVMGEMGWGRWTLKEFMVDL